MKKSLSALLIVAMVLMAFASTSFAAESDGFVDIEKSYAKDAILDLQAQGIIDGIDASHFNPSGKLSRAEFVAIMVRALGLEAKATKSSFTDVTGWAIPYIEAAVKAGIVTGTGNGLFAPSEPLTREAAAVILVRALQSKGLIDGTGATLNFKDADKIAKWAKDFIAIAQKYGLIKGNSDGTFNPKGTADRAMAAVMGSNLLTAIDTVKPTPTPTPTPEATPTPTPEPTAPPSGGGGTGPTPTPTPIDPLEYVQPQDFGYWVDATPDSAAYSVGFKLNLIKLPYNKISKIEVSLVDGSNHILAKRTATGAQLVQLASDDEDAGGADGQLSAAFIYREAVATNDWWNSTAYDFTTPAKAVITITDTLNRIIKVENTNLSGSSGEVSNPQDYLMAQDFGYWNDQFAYNVGFKIDVEKLPYGDMRIIEVALTGASGEVLATRTATGTQIAKLAADDATYEPIDGQLSAAFIYRDAEGMNDWWTSTPYNMTTPSKAVITIIDKSNRVIKVESGGPSSTAPIYAEPQDFGALPGDGYNLGFKLNLDALGGYDNIEFMAGTIKDADGNTIGQVTVDTPDRIQKFADDDETYGGLDGQLSFDFHTESYLEDPDNGYGVPVDGLYQTSYMVYLVPLPEESEGITPATATVEIILKSGMLITVNYIYL